MLDKDWLRVPGYEARWHRRSKWWTKPSNEMGEKKRMWVCGITRYRHYKRHYWKLVNVDGLATFAYCKERAVAKKVIAINEEMPVRTLWPY